MYNPVHINLIQNHWASGVFASSLEALVLKFWFKFPEGFIWLSQQTTFNQILVIAWWHQTARPMVDTNLHPHVALLGHQELIVQAFSSELKLNDGLLITVFICLQSNFLVDIFILYISFHSIYFRTLLNCRRGSCCGEPDWWGCGYGETLAGTCMRSYTVLWIIPNSWVAHQTTHGGKLGRQIISWLPKLFWHIFKISVAVNYRNRRYKSIWKFRSIIDMDFWYRYIESLTLRRR